MDKDDENGSSRTFILPWYSVEAMQALGLVDVNGIAVNGLDRENMSEELKARVDLTFQTYRDLLNIEENCP